VIRATGFAARVKDGCHTRSTPPASRARGVIIVMVVVVVIVRRHENTHVRLYMYFHVRNREIGLTG
jgi:hypothetical protein